MKKLLFLAGFLSFSFVQSKSIVMDARRDMAALKMATPYLYVKSAYQAYKTDNNKEGFYLAPLMIPVSLAAVFSGFIEQNAINAASSILNKRTSQHDQNLVFNTMETIFGSPLS